MGANHIFRTALSKLARAAVAALSRRASNRNADPLHHAAATCDALERRLFLTVSLASIDNQFVDEGSSLNLNVAAYVNYYDENDPDEYANVLINFGDGTTASASVGTGASFLSFPHLYPDDGVFSGSVTVTGSVEGHATSSSFDVNVNDVLPDIRLAGSNNATRYQPYTLDLFHADPGQDPIDHWLIEWGDGHSSTVAGLSTSATHRYDSIPEANYTGDHPAHIRVQAVEADTDTVWPTGAIMTGNSDGYYETDVNVYAAPPDSPYDLHVAPLSRSKVQLAWRMPLGSDPDGYTIASSTDGVHFALLAMLPTASLSSPIARSYVASGLDPLTNYSFKVSADYGEDDSTYTDTAIATTTDDEWEDVEGADPVTPAFPGPGQLAGPPEFFNDGDDLPAGMYRLPLRGRRGRVGRWLRPRAVAGRRVRHRDRHGGGPDLVRLPTLPRQRRELLLSQYARTGPTRRHADDLVLPPRRRPLGRRLRLQLRLQHGDRPGRHLDAATSATARPPPTQRRSHIGRRG